MKKNAPSSKKPVQRTLNSFFNKKACGDSNTNAVVKNGKLPCAPAVADTKKRKRSASPRKSPVKNNRTSPMKVSPPKRLDHFSIDESVHNREGGFQNGCRSVEELPTEVSSTFSGNENQKPRRSPRLEALQAAKKQSPKKMMPKLLFSPAKKVVDKVEESDVVDHFDDLSSINFNDALLEIDDFESSFQPAVAENLNLTKLSRYKVVHTSKAPPDELNLAIKSLTNETSGSCIVKSPWSSSIIREGDTISVKGTLINGSWVVDWSGLLVTNADHLVSGTAIVGSLFCRRKAVLSEIFDELGDVEPKHLVIGSIVHQLLQEVLRKKLRNRSDIEDVCKGILENPDFVMEVFLQNMDYNETAQTVKKYLPQVYNFISKYVTYSKAESLAPKEPDDWQGEITNIRDIEENIWSPSLGIKGKIDATVQVKIRNKSKLMPLELKTGKVSFSIEHRGQVILYCMLLKEIGEFVDSGLLLYLKDKETMQEIRVEDGAREIRDLILLRNSLSNGILDLSNLVPSENIRLPNLPPVINRKACQSCGHLVACSAALRDNGLDSLGENHFLKKLAPQVTSHLSDKHMAYIFHWIGLQSLENGSSKHNITSIWTENPHKREENRTCLTNLFVASSEVTTKARFETVLKKKDNSSIDEIFDAGQTVIISSATQVAVCFGFITSISNVSITLAAEKYFKANEGPFILDCYESVSAKKITIKNLSLLLDNSDKAKRMREIIIDLKLPSFAPKLSSKIKKFGLGILEKLNKEQVRALLQAISADTYILIQGMPGTGKTTTMRALIELLVRMGNRVLVSSYTHSAIDNILIGLVGKVKMMRFASNQRVHHKLRNYTERSLISTLGENPSHDQLEKLYSSQQVYGVSCLSAGHLWLARQEFDVCLVDEASQVTQPAVLRPLFLAKKFILVGDPKQLPPLVVNKQAKEFGLGVSLFQRLDRPAVTTRLTRQYRMNQPINDLANYFSYDGMLQCGSETIATATLDYTGETTRNENWIRRPLSKLIEDSIVVVDMKSDASKLNETDVVLQIAQEMLKVGVPADNIGVICTYRERVDLIKRSLKGTEIEVSTVDQYQGRDKDVVIYAVSASSKKTETDVLPNVNRLTVAITRAKKKLVIVCSVNCVRAYENFAKLFNHVPSTNFIDGPL